jgi:hypothetical protein
VPADSGTQDDDLAFMINKKLNNISAAFAILAAAVLLLALGYSVKEILSPFLLIIALTYVLYPFRAQEVVRRVLWLAGGVFVFWLLYSLAGLLAPVIVALLLAYVFNPLVNRIAQRLPRRASSLIVTIGALGVIVGVMVFVLPIAIRQLEGLNWDRGRARTERPGLAQVGKAVRCSRRARHSRGRRPRVRCARTLAEIAKHSRRVVQRNVRIRYGRYLAHSANHQHHHHSVFVLLSLERFP